MAVKTKGGIATAKPVVVTIGGDEYELTPNIQAVRAINAAFGGLRPALDAVQALNFDAVAQVIAAGSGGMKLKEIQAIGETLWVEEDRADTMGSVVEYLVTLLNGGRPVSADEDKKGASEGN